MYYVLSSNILAIVDDGAIENEDKNLLELEVIGGAFTGMVAFGLILVIVLGIVIAVVAKSKRGNVCIIPCMERERERERE